MAEYTRIEWTDVTWNPTTGCDRVSAGCDHCYALAMAGRLKAMGQAKYQRDGDSRTSGPGFGVSVHYDALELPLRWRKPRRVFVNSMSDLFHRDVPDVFIARVWEIMRATPQHTYQILTKRHARLRSLFPPPVPGRSVALPNAHVGVSAEDQHWAEIRLPALLEADLAGRFVSCEPLLGPIDLTPWLGTGRVCPGDSGAAGLSWVIVGGESGGEARPCDPDWIHSVVNQCRNAHVPVFVKQLGTAWARRHRADPKGGNSTHWPPSLRVREFPDGDPAHTTNSAKRDTR